MQDARCNFVRRGSEACMPAQAIISTPSHIPLLTTESLTSRAHDMEERVRVQAIKTLVAAARTNPENLHKPLIDLITDRCLDKKIAVRREAITGLGQLYKKVYAIGQPQPQSQSQQGQQDEMAAKYAAQAHLLQFVPSRLFRNYMQQTVEDK